MNYKIIKRENGWVTAVGANGQVVRVSVGGNGK
jgi:hypothetical protein